LLKHIYISLFCISIFFLCSCNPSPYSKKVRLEKFTSLFTAQTQKYFYRGNYPEVISTIETLYQKSAQFRNRYNMLKQEEAIVLFSPKEVVNFYAQYFLTENDKKR